MKKDLLIALAGVLCAFLAGMAILAAQGYDAPRGFMALIEYSLMSEMSFGGTLQRAAPLILTGLSATVAFGSNAVNLGQLGQVLIGAMAVTTVGLHVDLPAPLMLPLLLATAAIAGGLWCGIAAWLRNRFNMNEFISTLMLNFLAEYFTLWMVRGPVKMINANTPMSPPIADGGHLPALGSISSSILVALVALGGIYLLWNRSRVGYEMRMMGLNPVFTRIGGCHNRENFTRAMLISGALAGLAGGLLIMGGIQHQFLIGIGGTYGWDGVMLAIIANCHVLATSLYALLFAVLQNGALGMELETRVPSEFIMVFQAIIVLFVVASREVSRRLVNLFIARRVASEALATTRQPSEERVHGSVS